MGKENRKLKPKTVEKKKKNWKINYRINTQELEPKAKSDSFWKLVKLKVSYQGE